MTTTFSVLHATRGRPAKAHGVMRLFEDLACLPSHTEYIFCRDKDENPSNAYFKTGFFRCREVENPGVGSAPAWNHAAEESEGHILIQSQDDIEPPKDWDALIMDRVTREIGIDWKERPWFMAVSDGYTARDLCCTAIMNRAYMKLEGHFLFPGYRSVFSDDEATYRALRHNRDGTATMILARDIAFKHHHYTHDPAVKCDKTYEESNSAENYRLGRALFHQRNPDARRDGLISWRMP